MKKNSEQPDNSHLNDLQIENESLDLLTGQKDPVIMMAEQLLQTLENKIQARTRVVEIPDDVPRFELC